jgi:predicted nucleotidyltransferase
MENSGVIIMPSKIIIPQEKVRDFCHRNHIQKLALFGSVLRDDFGSESDIDVLVEFEPGAGVGFFELYDMEEEFSRLFGGRKVEITTPRSLSKYFRDSVLKNAEVQYART